MDGGRRDAVLHLKDAREGRGIFDTCGLALVLSWPSQISVIIVRISSI